ncbi:hypothetical protein ES703_41654 [subsurface metagenome]
MEKDSPYRSEAKDERSTLFIIRRDGPVAICELPAKWIKSLLKKRVYKTGRNPVLRGNY